MACTKIQALPFPNKMTLVKFLMKVCSVPVCEGGMSVMYVVVVCILSSVA